MKQIIVLGELVFTNTENLLKATGLKMTKGKDPRTKSIKVWLS